MSRDTKTPDLQQAKIPSVISLASSGIKYRLAAATTALAFSAHFPPPAKARGFQFGGIG